MTEHQSSNAQAPCTFELWDYSGTPARIGTAQTGTASTSTGNISTALFTGVTYAQLATLRVRIYGHSDSPGLTESADGANLTISYSPAADTGHVLASTVTATVTIPAPAVRQDRTAAPATAAVSTAQPAVTVTTSGNATAAPAVLAVTTTVPFSAAGSSSSITLIADDIISAATDQPQVTVTTAAGTTATPATLAVTTAQPAPGGPAGPHRRPGHPGRHDVCARPRGHGRRIRYHRPGDSDGHDSPARPGGPPGPGGHAGNPGRHHDGTRTRRHGHQQRGGCSRHLDSRHGPARRDSHHVIRRERHTGHGHRHGSIPAARGIRRRISDRRASCPGRDRNDPRPGSPAGPDPDPRSPRRHRHRPGPGRGRRREPGPRNPDRHRSVPGTHHKQRHHRHPVPSGRHRVHPADHTAGHIRHRDPGGTVLTRRRRRRQLHHRNPRRPAMIDVGQVYHATLTIKNQATPPATATLTITLPDGTTLTPGVGAGTASGPDWVFAYDYATTMAGLHKAAWLTTVPGTAAADAFNVRAYNAILSLAEAKTHLGANPATWTADDDELRNFLQAVTEVVESKVGPCVRRTVTQRAGGGGGYATTLALTQYPILTVTSVTSVWTGGPTWTGTQLITDTDAGTITVQLGSMPFWYGPWDVVYTTGRAVIPERILHGAKELLRHLWETQRGQLQAGALTGGEPFTSSTGQAFSIPNRVLEMLADDMTPAV